MKVVFCLLNVVREHEHGVADWVKACVARWPYGIFTLITDSTNLEMFTDEQIEVFRIASLEELGCTRENYHFFVAKIMNLITENFKPSFTFRYTQVPDEENFNIERQGGSFGVAMHCGIQGENCYEALENGRKTEDQIWQSIQLLIKRSPEISITLIKGIPASRYRELANSLKPGCTIHLSLPHREDLDEIGSVLGCFSGSQEVELRIPTSYLFSLTHQGASHAVTDLLRQKDLFKQIMRPFRIRCALPRNIRIKVINQSYQTWIGLAVTAYSFLLNFTGLACFGKREFDGE